jgi:predicted transposase/invertase (TIGR01784 family)
MNNKYYDGIYERNDLYQHTVMSRVTTRGDKYPDFKRVIQINIDNFDKFIKEISTFRVMEVDTHELENIGYLKYHINLPKIRKKYYNNEKLNYLEKLFLIISIDNDYELNKISKGDVVMEEFKDKVEELNYDELFSDILSAEWKRKDNEKVERTILYNAEQEGLRIGMEKGIEKGIEKGKLDVAKNMLDNGMDISLISKYTGISELELKNISK